MRRFVYEDRQYDVKVTVDVSEEMYQGIRHTKTSVKDAIKRLATYTLENEKVEETDDTEST